MATAIDVVTVLSLTDYHDAEGCSKKYEKVMVEQLGKGRNHHSLTELMLGSGSVYMLRSICMKFNLISTH